MLFGILKRAILDLHQKKETHSCYISNVYLWFSITTGYGEINCCSLLCLKTPIDRFQISFSPLFFFSPQIFTQTRIFLKSNCGLIYVLKDIVIKILEEKLESS